MPTSQCTSIIRLLNCALVNMCRCGRTCTPSKLGAKNARLRASIVQAVTRVQNCTHACPNTRGWMNAKLVGVTVDQLPAVVIAIVEAEEKPFAIVDALNAPGVPSSRRPAEDGDAMHLLCQAQFGTMVIQLLGHLVSKRLGP